MKTLFVLSCFQDDQYQVIIFTEYDIFFFSCTCWIKLKIYNNFTGRWRRIRITCSTLPAYFLFHFPSRRQTNADASWQVARRRNRHRHQRTHYAKTMRISAAPTKKTTALNWHRRKNRIHHDQDVNYVAVSFLVFFGLWWSLL